MLANKNSPHRFLVILFTCTISLGAFLLFQLQPIMGKYLLPSFGGSSSVWTTAMLFFQAVLLLGYGYSLLLSRFPVRTQLLIHATVLTLSMLTVFVLFFRWVSPIMAPKEWLHARGVSSPIIAVMEILVVGVGVPYFLLSTTSTLLQHWFHRTGGGESVYRLYAVSNVSSLIGVSSYPFLVEPLLSLRLQGFWWSICFLVYAGFYLGSVFYTALWVRRNNSKSKKHQEVRSTTKFNISSLGRRQVLLWFFLSSAASLLLLATTTQLTQSIAPAPFLWLLPLDLYLVSFVLFFSGIPLFRKLDHGYSYLFLWSALALWVLQTQSLQLSIWGGSALYGVLLISGFMLCHGELYAVKPAARHLPFYYFVIALGGVFGGIVAGIVSPLVFRGFWEFPIVLYSISLFACIVLVRNQTSLLYRWLLFGGFHSKREIYAFLFTTLTILFVLLPRLQFTAGWKSLLTLFQAQPTMIVSSRNFYGVVRVSTSQTSDGVRLALINGKITHGYQYRDGPLGLVPISYYHLSSGIGLAFDALRDRVASVSGGKSLRAGIIGLGIGTIAAYGEKGDEFRFYDINPAIVPIAREQFHYLTDSRAAIDVVVADGRLSLEKEVSEGWGKKYDMFILDAFTDDAIPLHLLTREAFELYAKALKPGGVIAVHISNSYLDLYPVVAGASENIDFDWLKIETQANEHGVLHATWIVMSKDKELIRMLPASASAKPKKIPLWTDDYSNLLYVLR